MKKQIRTMLTLFLLLSLSLNLMPFAFTSTQSKAETKANALKQLGLFRGVSENDFALERKPTRTEALVMLIRTLGKASEAESIGGSHPFTDVPQWADKYVGYAYEKGLTKGTSSTTFGTENASIEMYLTFMLRALGYSDTLNDFSYSTSSSLAKAVGILPDNVDTENFLRADVVLISWEALKAGLKGGNQVLSEKLIENKVFTLKEYENAVVTANEVYASPVTVSSLEQFNTALTSQNTKLISIKTKDAPLIITGEITIPKGVSVTIERGSDFFVHGILTNNGTINIMGSDAIVNSDFINYSVMSVEKGGKIFNNGCINVMASVLSDTSDHGPVGGQLRIFDGSLENNGSVFLKHSDVNTHGGMLAVIEGSFTNNKIVISDGFQIAINSNFVNSKTGVIVNNSHLCTKGSGSFTNQGTLSGNPLESE